MMATVNGNQCGIDEIGPLKGTAGLLLLKQNINIEDTPLGPLLRLTLPPLWTISHEAAAVILNLIHANPSAEVTWDDVITGLKRLRSTAPSNNDAGTSRPSSRPEPYNAELSVIDNTSSPRYAPFRRTTTPSAPTRPTCELLLDV